MAPIAVSKRDRTQGWAIIAVTVAGIVAVSGGMLLVKLESDSGREEAVRETQRLQPVVAALERYRQERGEYPETLGELAPTYIPSVPSADYHRGGPRGYELQHFFSIYVISYRPGGFSKGEQSQQGSCLEIINGWCFGTT